MEICSKYLQDAGFDIELLPAEGVHNLWAWHGNGEPVCVLCGHLDVVPPGDEAAWSFPPFQPQIVDGKLYGRGSTDMKAGVAALLIAATRLVRSNSEHRGRVGVILTTDEEGKARHGTRHVVETLVARGEHFQYGLVGEPSSYEVFSDTLRVGRRGSMTCRVTMQGEQGHVAYPQRMSNPIPPLVDVVSALCALEFPVPPGQDEATALQVVSLLADAGASNVVPHTAHATINIRYVLADDPRQIQKRIEQICASAPFPCSCSWQQGSRPYHTKADSELVCIAKEACTAVTGSIPRLSVGGGTSDGRFLIDLCAEVVEFGTVGKTMHQIDEHVVIAELEPLVAIYHQVLCRILTAYP